jgi:hypothetical protein
MTHHDRKEQIRFEIEIRDAADGVLSILNSRPMLDNAIIEFEPRFPPMTVAQCFYTQNAYRLRFQWPLWRLLDQSERLEVVAHEVCHSVQILRIPNVEDAHGPEWRSLMKMVGYPNAGPEKVLNPIAQAHLLARLDRQSDAKMRRRTRKEK